MLPSSRRFVCIGLVALLWGLLLPAAVLARDPSPRLILDTGKPFQAFIEDLLAAIRKHKMGLVCRANAQAGAASRGVRIAGNQVFMLYRPDFAIRTLAADVEAGFEAPLRIYVVEKADGTARVSYIKPSDVFAGYHNPQLDAMARELDAIFAAIVHDAAQ
ncbi:MAG: hypothetical protein KatS3mg131_3120 [Candidatus Tectimicrobiota bacterium]|nr:MAG: hypothetical protein KatS3mg131_3120 [Candidatus Tectomicrobia bacterium]